MDFVGFLYGFGLLQGLLLASVLLVARSGNRLANTFMAGLVTAIALSLLQNWLVRTGFFLQQPATGLLIPPLDFVWGPLLYLYAYSLTNRQAHWLQIAHFIPALLMLSSAIGFMAYPLEDQRDILSYIWSQHTDPGLEQQVAGAVPPIWQTWINYHLQGNLFALQFGVYCFLVLRQIQQHNRRLQQHFSSMEHMTLRWLRSVTLACLAFLALFLGFNRSQLIVVGHFDVTALLPNIPYLFLVFLVYAAGIAAIFQSKLILGINAAHDNDPNQTNEAPTAKPDEITSPPSITQPAESYPDSALDKQPPPEEPTEAEEPSNLEGPAQKTAANSKYQRSGLSLEDAENYKIRLMQKMQQEQLYLDSELTLPELARHTELTPHQVSQVLNGQMQQNFFSFVNNYRIRLAKEIMSSEDTHNMPIVELAVEVGFKSKSSFYDAFKKATQMTPTQFKKSLTAN